jgi:hypothetical protein
MNIKKMVPYINLPFQVSVDENIHGIIITIIITIIIIIVMMMDVMMDVIMTSVSEQC